MPADLVVEGRVALAVRVPSSVVTLLSFPSLRTQARSQQPCLQSLGPGFALPVPSHALLSSALLSLTLQAPRSSFSGSLAGSCDLGSLLPSGLAEGNPRRFARTHNAPWPAKAEKGRESSPRSGADL